MTYVEAFENHVDELKRTFKRMPRGAIERDAAPTFKAGWDAALEHRDDDICTKCKAFGSEDRALIQTCCIAQTRHDGEVKNQCVLWGECQLKLSDGGCLPNCAKRIKPEVEA